jgi:hypothetical protein
MIRPRPPHVKRALRGTCQGDLAGLRGTLCRLDDGRTALGTEGAHAKDLFHE